MAGSHKKLRGVTEVVTQNHKRILNETEWRDLGSGNRPTNSTAQTFGLYYSGTPIPVTDSNFNNVTSAFGGLGGVESLPSSFTYADAEGVEVSVDPPTYNQLAVAGFAKPLGKYDNFIRKSAAKKASQINDQLDASEKVAARANADVLMKARVEEAEKIYNDLMNKYEAEKKAVDEYNKNVDNEYEKEKEKVRVHNEKITFQHHKTMSGVKWDSKTQMGVPDLDNVPPGSDLDIQNKLNAKYIKNGVMTITPEKWAQLFDEMGGKANQETRERLEKKIKPVPERPPYKNYPPLPDYPDVYNDSIWNDGLNSSTNKVTPSKDPSSLEKLFTSLKAGFWQVTKIESSIRNNKQIVVNPTSKEINKFTKTINKTQLSLIPVSQTPLPYSDSNFKEVNGKLVQHQGNSPDYTKNMAWGGEGSEIGDRGSAMIQIVTPTDGEPYILYTDHAYMNTNNPDDATAVQDLGASIVQGIWKSDPTGGMPGVYGDVKTEFSIPVSSLSASQQAAVFLNINSRKKRDEKNKLKESKTFKNFMSSINN